MTDSVKPAVHLRVAEFAPKGATIEYAVVIANEGSESIDVYLAGREITFDFTVTDKSGAKVYSRLEGAITPAILRVENLPPGEAMTLQDSWDQRDAAGNYVPLGFYSLQASVMTDGAPLQSQDALLHITNL